MLSLQKRLLALTTVLAISLSSQAQAAPSDPNRPIHDKWALIIGISKFKDNTLNLKYSAKDAQDFADFLVKEGNFASNHVKVLVDEKATRENILDCIGDRFLPRVTHADDLVLIYISSHGSPDAMDIGGVNYIIANDTDKNRLYSTGIAMQDLARIVKRVRSDRVLLLLDACHSGAASVVDQKGLVRTGNINAEEIAQGTGQLVLCSSGTNEVSWESKRYANSVFTHHLMSALKQRGNTTKLKEAFTTLKDTVETEVRRDRGVEQIPVLKGQWLGDELMVAVPPSHPGPGLEDELDTTAADNTNSNTIATTAPPPVSVPDADNEKKSVKADAATQPCLIAVLPFAGPEEVNCKGGGLMSAVRGHGFKQPREADFHALPEAWRANLTEKLKSSFGDKIKGPQELSNGAPGAYYTQNVPAEYLLEGAIHEIEYDGGDLFGNKYEIKFSCDLLSGATRKRLFSIQERVVSGFLKGDSDPLSQIYKTVLDRMSTIITEKTLAKIQPAQAK